MSLNFSEIKSELTKTGTTIVGVEYGDGVVLAADTRSTAGPVVKNKHALKIHRMADDIWCCGAGTAADTRRVTAMASRKLREFSYKNQLPPRISHAERVISDHLHSYGGHIGAHLIMGGSDGDKPFLISMSADGFISYPKHSTLGSGSFAAEGVLNGRYKLDMSLEEAKELAADAIESGIVNDLYSGSQVDLVVIPSNKPSYLIRGYRVVCKRPSRMTNSELQTLNIKKEDLFKFVEITE